jgi:hypothetical protein
MQGSRAIAPPAPPVAAHDRTNTTKAQAAQQAEVQSAWQIHAADLVTMVLQARLQRVLISTHQQLTRRGLGKDTA